MHSQWNLLIAGRVQAVGMRQMVSEKARTLGLRGTVKNNLDGTVEIRIAGTKLDLKNFETWLRASPGSSSVTVIRKFEIRDEGYKNFTIVI
ncbi:MAG: acylphosphatase [Patescibacteria group bacterium]|nr:acylphosphatase [Patescibacteria group bacterium]MDD5715116.1 acylphosphatase [Patescibacteria group bacterium]